MCLILTETYERRNSYPSSQRSDTARHEYDNRVFRETSPSSCFCFIKNWLLDTQRHAPPVHQKTTTGVWRPIWTKKHKQQSTIQDLASPITSSHWCVCVCNGKLCISCKSSLFCVRLQEQRWSSSLEYTKTNGGWRHILGEYKSHEQQTIHKTKVIVIGMCSCVCVCWVACISQYRARCLFHAIEFLTRRHQTHTWDDTCRQTAAASEVYWSEATWKMPLIGQRSVCVCVCVRYAWCFIFSFSQTPKTRPTTTTRPRILLGNMRKSSALLCHHPTIHASVFQQWVVFDKQRNATLPKQKKTTDWRCTPRNWRYTQRKDNIQQCCCHSSSRSSRFGWYQHTSRCVTHTDDLTLTTWCFHRRWR